MDRSTEAETVTDTAAGAATPARAVARRWPTGLGIAVGAWAALDMSEGADLAPALAAMAVIYVAAAALGRPAAAWVVFPVAFLVVLISQELVSDAAATWAQVGAAGLFLGCALVPGARRRPDRGTLLRQVAGMAGFAAVAGAALALGDDAGAYLVVAGLLGHAAWDAYHHRRDEAVARSYAEFCSVLDSVVAAAVVVAAVGG